MQKNNSHSKAPSPAYAKASADKQKEQVFVKKQDEKILVVKKNFLFSYQTFNGLKKVVFDDYQKLINKHKKFLWRSKMEVDTSYKQIIPYLVFSYEDQFFMMKRRNTSSEARLKNKYSLGIGGHIREEDIKKGNIIDWARPLLSSLISRWRSISGVSGALSMVMTARVGVLESTQRPYSLARERGPVSSSLSG